MSKVDKTIQQLQKGLDELFVSDKYTQYLDTMSKFHNYSINNCLLISMQKPDATLVAGYTTWRDKFHRHVLKGEKGITIIAPTPFKTTREIEVKDTDGNTLLNNDGTPVVETKEFIHQSYSITKVFDISQTDGEPLPSITSELRNPVDGFDYYLNSIRDLSPVPIRFDDIASGAKGYYSPSKQEIVIQRGMSEEQTLKTAIHECAHARLGHGGENDYFDKNTREVQAESIAYCCCKHIGIDTKEYSFGYIAGWSSGRDTKELKESLEIIKKESDQIITGLESKMNQILSHEHNFDISIDKPNMKMSI